MHKDERSTEDQRNNLTGFMVHGKMMSKTISTFCARVVQPKTDRKSVFG